MAESGEATDPFASFAGLLPRLHLRVLIPLLFVGILVVVSTLIFGVDGLNSAIQGVTDASIIIPGAVGLSLLYGIRKFANFAHGELMTLGGYTAYLVNAPVAAAGFQLAVNGLGLDLFWGFLIAPIVLAGVGILLELLIFSKLEGRGSIAPLVASIGLSLFLQSLVSVLWGTDIKAYVFIIPVNWVFFGGVTLNPIKGALTIGLSLLFMAAMHLILTRTTLGKAMRATADNMELARTTGIRTKSVILWTWVLSAALAGVGGILIGIARDVRPTMGFDLLLPIFAAVILGGIGSPYGAMVGGLVIGLTTDMSIPYLHWMDVHWGLVNGAAYSPAVAFLIMVIVLLIRPEGMLGVRRERGGTGALRWLSSRLFPKDEGAESVEKEGE